MNEPRRSWRVLPKGEMLILMVHMASALRSVAKAEKSLKLLMYKIHRRIVLNQRRGEYEILSLGTMGDVPGDNGGARLLPKEAIRYRAITARLNYITAT